MVTHMMHGVKCIMNMIGTIMHVLTQMAVFHAYHLGLWIGRLVKKRMKNQLLRTADFSGYMKSKVIGIRKLSVTS